MNVFFVITMYLLYTTTQIIILTYFTIMRVNTTCNHTFICIEKSIGVLAKL